MPAPTNGQAEAFGAGLAQVKFPETFKLTTGTTDAPAAPPSTRPPSGAVWPRGRAR